MHRSVEFVEDALLNHVGDLSTDAAVGLIFFDVDGAVRFRDGFENGVFIQRTNAAQIDDLGADAVFFFEDACGFEAGDDSTPMSDEGDVGAFAFHVCKAERNEEFAVGEFIVGGHVPFGTVKDGAFHEHDGVIVTDGSLHKALGIVSVAGADAFHTWETGHDILWRVAVCGAYAGAAVGRATDDNGHVDLATAHVAHHGAIIDDLIPGHGVEAPKHQFHHRTHTEHAGTDSHADEAGLTDRGIHEAFVAPLFPQALRYFVCAVVLGHFFTHDHDHGVAGDFFIKGFTDGVAVGDSAGHSRIFGGQ